MGAINFVLGSSLMLVPAWLPAVVHYTLVTFCLQRSVFLSQSLVFIFSNTCCTQIIYYMFTMLSRLHFFIFILHIDCT